MAATVQVKKSAVKKAKAPKTVSHPSYFEMIKEAILALKEKSGSSPHAIAKHMEINHKALPSNFRKLLALQLKNSASKGKLIKIKASFKLSEAAKKPTASKPKAAKKITATKPKDTAKLAEKKPKAKKTGALKKAAKAAAKPKPPKSIKSPAVKRAKRASAKA